MTTADFFCKKNYQDSSKEAQSGHTGLTVELVLKLLKASSKKVNRQTE